MEGDFSRGHRPDGKRGMRYRRVLVEQGAAILDSDVAALVDASERMVREAVTHAACTAGSPDLGFLVTSGELLALFYPAFGAAPTTSGGAEAVRDFSRKYLDRLPGLRIRGSGGQVRVPLRRPLSASTALRLWLRADAGATATVNGTAVPIPAGPNYAPFALTASGTELVLAPDPVANYWLALVETVTPAGPAAALHWAAGGFQIGGMIATTPGAAWPDLPDPAGAALVTESQAPAGTAFVAYLELCERHITGVEDPGIVERALGGDQDTTTRTAVHAQVKLARVTGAPTSDAIIRSIEAPNLPDGTVTLGVAAAAAAADPCDLPVPGGYTGPDNRLYRLAVHSVTTGAGGETLFKWSRDNGSELFSAAFPDTGPVDSLIVAAHLPLRDGELVEILSDATDRGDAAPGAVTAAGFTRPRRAQGLLIRLSGGEQITGSTRVFTFRDPLTEAPVATINAAPFGTAGLKIRRWSGLIRRPGTGPADVELERGIRAAIDGAFEPGAFWQYEARTLAENANGPAVPSPHGPERLFAPLALLEAPPTGEPMRLVEWLDRRYRRLCDAEADAVAYDGTRVGTEADTVQEALDELYLRVSDGCGEIAVPASGSIQDVIDAIPVGGSARICLNAGTRDLTAPVRVQNKGDLIVAGIGCGTLLRNNARQILVFENCRSVALRDFAVQAGPGSGAIIGFSDCGEVTVENLRVEGGGPVAHGGAAIRVRMTTAVAQARATIRHNRLSLGANDTGILLIDAGAALVSDNLIAVRNETFNLPAALDDPALASAVGTVLLDSMDFHGDNTDAFDFVGGPVINFALAGQSVTRRGIAMAPRVWGRSILSFTTDARLSSQFWARLVRVNPPPGGDTTASLVMRDFLRQFRRGLARTTVLGTTGGPVTVPAGDRPTLNTIAGLMLTSNQLVHGTAGIVVGQGRTALRSRDDQNNVVRMFRGGPGQTVTVAHNRIRGFRQGVHVGASRARDDLNIMHAADIRENHVELRLPMQAKQRHGIFVGNALTARVTGNRVENLAYEPTPLAAGAPPRAAVDCDGIRLRGAFGPLVEVRGNLNYGVTVGVRFVNSGPAGPPLGVVTVQNARVIADNAYVGDGQAQISSP